MMEHLVYSYNNTNVSGLIGYWLIDDCMQHILHLLNKKGVKLDGEEELCCLVELWWRVGKSGKTALLSRF